MPAPIPQVAKDDLELLELDRRLYLQPVPQPEPGLPATVSGTGN